MYVCNLESFHAQKFRMFEQSISKSHFDKPLFLLVFEYCHLVKLKTCKIHFLTHFHLRKRPDYTWKCVSHECELIILNPLTTICTVNSSVPHIASRHTCIMPEAVFPIVSKYFLQLSHLEHISCMSHTHCLFMKS